MDVKFKCRAFCSFSSCNLLNVQLSTLLTLRRVFVVYDNSVGWGTTCTVLLFIECRNTSRVSRVWMTFEKFFNFLYLNFCAIFAFCKNRAFRSSAYAPYFASQSTPSALLQFLVHLGSQGRVLFFQNTYLFSFIVNQTKVLVLSYSPFLL